VVFYDGEICLGGGVIEVAEPWTSKSPGMSPTQEQLTALGGVFLAAVLVDRIAKTGQTSEAGLTCMLGSLLVRDPKDTLEVYGGDDLNLREGYRALIGALERDRAPCSANRCATPCRCSALSANWPSAATCSTSSATACRRSSPRSNISARPTKT
jgi:hypothetical protein